MTSQTTLEPTPPASPHSALLAPPRLNPWLFNARLLKPALRLLARVMLSSLAEVGLPDTLTLHARDLWTGHDLGPVHGNFTSPAVPAHGVILLSLHP